MYLISIDISHLQEHANIYSFVKTINVWRFCMKNISAIIVLTFLIFLSTAFAEDASADQLKQTMLISAYDVASYDYSRVAQTAITYKNETLQDSFGATKETVGKVNLTAQSGWWSHQLKDDSTGEVLLWQGYLVNGTEYWKEGDNWTEFSLDDSQAILDDYNDLPGQVELLNYSNMTIEGSEEIDGIDCYKITSEPIDLIQKAILGTQIFASYLAAPFPLPDEFEAKDFDFDNTSIVENSDVSVTAWVSKNDSLLRRMTIDSSLKLTPEILKISEQNFTIQSALHETTDYRDFDQPVQIELPSEATNSSYRIQGADWRWGIFGLVEP
jgi:hypothetical protein